MSEPATPSTPREERPHTSASGYITSSSSRTSLKKQRRQTNSNDDRTTEVLQLAEEKLKEIKDEDAFDVFGKHIAFKLRSLTERQNMFAQKLINDVIFEAQMETLTKDFKIINCAKKPQHISSYNGSVVPQSSAEIPITFAFGNPGAEVVLPTSDMSALGQQGDTLTNYFTHFPEN